MLKSPYPNCQALEQRAWRIEGEIASQSNIPKAEKNPSKPKKPLFGLCLVWIAFFITILIYT